MVYARGALGECPVETPRFCHDLPGVRHFGGRYLLSTGSLVPERATSVTQNVFIPLTDDLLLTHPELRHARLVPYQPGVTIWRVVDIDEDEDQGARAETAAAKKRGAVDRGPNASRSRA